MAPPILAFFMLLCFPVPRGLAAETRKPNIIVILADDLGYGSLGCYGSKEVRTPHIDQLAAGGLRLTDFHSNGPLCTPTRAALLTGRYQQRCARVPDEQLSPVFLEQREKNPDQRWAWGISTDEYTLPKMFSGTGYRAALIGKWHLGYDIRFHPMNHGFDEFRGFVGGGIDYHTHIATHGTKELDWWTGREIANESGYTTDLLTRHAVDFIGRNKERPFFLYLAHAAPHTPWQGRDSGNRKPAGAIYREMIEILDSSVGEVLKCLRDHNLEEHTMVVFCSDNGPQAPGGFPAAGPLKGRKGSLFEGGHRVPCIVRWPGMIPEGRTADEVVMSMDLLPTFAKLSGATLPAGQTIDGMDMMPYFMGEAKAHRRIVHWKHGASWAVRDGPWKLIGRGTEPETLVNLADDLSETTNWLPEKPELARQLAQTHLQWEKEILAP